LDAAPPSSADASPSAPDESSPLLREALSHLADRRWAAAYRALLRHKGAAERLRVAARAMPYKNLRLRLSPIEAPADTAGAAKSGIALPVPVMAVSRLEQYAACPFSYFARYILGAEPRKAFVLEAPDIGSFVHQAMDGTARKLSPEDWLEGGAARIERVSGEVIESLLGDGTRSVFSANKRNLFLKDRVKKTVAFCLAALAKQIEAGAYAPWRTEMDFSETETEILLPDGSRVALRGRIDRVDIARAADIDGNVGVGGGGGGGGNADGAAGFVRVIDYKTGSRAFSLNDIYLGLSFQLPVYLEMALRIVSRETRGRYLPGGMFYFNVKRPMADARKKGRFALSDAEIEDNMTRQMNLNGVAIGGEDRFLATFEQGASGSSRVVRGVRFTKGGDFYKTVFSPGDEGFAVIQGAVRQNIQRLCAQMAAGDYPVSPYRMKGRAPCAYCRYRGVCQLDLAHPGAAYRVLEPRGDAAAFKRMQIEQAQAASREATQSEPQTRASGQPQGGDGRG